MDHGDLNDTKRAVTPTASAAGASVLLEYFAGGVQRASLLLGMFRHLNGPLAEVLPYFPAC